MPHLTLGSPSNPRLLFLHGFMGCKEDWIEIMKPLSAHFYCVAIDLPQEGDLLAQIQALNFDNIIGYSFGGRLAMQIPARKKAILSAHPGLDDPQEKNKRYEKDLKWAQLLREIPFSSFLKKWYEQPCFSTLKVDEALMNKRLKNDPFALAELLKNYSLGKQEAIRDFKNILFLFGEHDLKYAKLYGHLVPERSRVEIKGASHALLLEKPQECANAILKFMEEKHDHC
jgi:2-succinyl-6-hydroxy-2,4-cyclohexadiene-1-carboxylate synthase